MKEVIIIYGNNTEIADYQSSDHDEFFFHRHIAQSYGQNKMSTDRLLQRKWTELYHGLDTGRLIQYLTMKTIVDAEGFI